MNNKRCIMYSAYGPGFIDEATKAATITRSQIETQETIVLHTELGSRTVESEDGSFIINNNIDHRIFKKVFDNIYQQEVPAMMYDNMTEKEYNKVKDRHNRRKVKAQGKWKHLKPNGIGRRKDLRILTGIKVFLFKIMGMIYMFENSRFDKMLFLDSDAAIIQNRALSIFDLLDEFDIAAAHAPAGLSRGTRHNRRGIPRAFPEYNTGVIGLHRNSLPFLHEWKELYLNTNWGTATDQGAFRKLLYTQKPNLATLHHKYNNRKMKPGDSCIWHHRAMFTHKAFSHLI